MSDAPALTHLVDSFRFWDVVSLWARERLEHEELIARALAHAVVHDGLRLNSIDLRWEKVSTSKLSFDGTPYVGFRPNPSKPIMALRAEVLEHLFAIVRRAEPPSRQIIRGEFIVRDDFADWLTERAHPRPGFWFP